MRAFFACILHAKWSERRHQTMAIANRATSLSDDFLDQRETENQLFSLLREMLIELHPGVTLPTLKSDSFLQDELGIDSLARTELMARVELNFKVRLQDQSIMSAERVSDVVHAIRLARQTQQMRAPQPHPLSVVPTPSALGKTEMRGGPEASPGHAETLIDVLEWRAQVEGPRVWTQYYSEEDRLESLSFQQLLERARQVAAGIRQMDLPAKPNVAIMLPTCLEFFYCFYGILMAGGIPVPLYPPDRPSRIEEHMKRQLKIFSNSRASLLITSKEILPFRSILKSRLPELVHVFETREVMKPGPSFERIRLKGEDTAFLQYTSGSTGDPKGVALNHFNLLSNIRAYGEIIRPTDKDIFVSWLPLYHDMGLIGAAMGTLYFGVPLVLMSPLHFIARPERWLWAISKHKATLSAAPNFAYELCARKAKDPQMAGLDLSSWRAAYNGAEPVRASTLRRFAERFQKNGFRYESFVPIYGLAESTVGLTFPPSGRGPVIDHVRRESFLKNDKAVPVPSTDPDAMAVVGCGMPLPHHEVRIADSFDRELTDREIGRIQFRGPSSTSGYYRNPKATRELFHGDWLDTGDYGYLWEGELFVTGREKDMIIRAGRHIFPYELEDAIGEIPEIRKGGVAVFGRTDSKTGTEQMIILAEVRRPDLASEELKEKIRDLVVDAVGIPPDDIVLAPAHAVLKTPSGKIRRKDCLKLYEQGKLGKSAPVWWQFIKLRSSALVPSMARELKRLRLFAYGTYFYLVTIVLAIPMILGILLLPKVSWRVRFSQDVLRFLWFVTGTSVRVRGIENMKKNQPQVVVVNHSSYIDSLILGSYLPGRFHFIAKKELKTTFLMGLLIRRLGGLFVERVDPASATHDTEQMVEALGRGESAIIFPEGTFTRAPGLKAFRMGAFWSAARAGVPLIPVTLRGTRSLFRYGWVFPHRASIAITFSPAIHPNGSSWKEAIRLRDSARAEILRHCGEPDLGQ